MKQSHVAAERINAIETLRMCHVQLGADFHVLPSWSVDLLLAEADRVKYRKPANANGSRARYFHDMLQRRAKRSK